MKLRSLCAIPLMLLLAIGASAKCRSAGLSDTINIGLITADNAVSALVLLGEQTGICFAIEVTGSDLLSHQVFVTGENKELAGVIRDLLPRERYELAVADNVVLVRSTAPIATTQTQLDIVVPEYKVESVTVPEASLALFFHLKKLDDPSIQGFAGHYSNHFPEAKVLPIVEHEKTAREILTKIVANSDGGAWIAGPCPKHELRTSQGTCWTILEYRDGPDNLIRQLANVVTELRAKISGKP